MVTDEPTTAPAADPTVAESAAELEVKATETADAPAPRRSSRLSTQSQPKVTDDAAAKEAERKKARETRRSRPMMPAKPPKRPAEEGGEDNDSSKKAKSEPSATKAVDIGDTLPEITLKSHKDEDVDVSAIAIGPRGVVIFLVPKADTPGCTQQACGFRDNWDEFGKNGYDVYCLSADKPQAQDKWSTKKELQYTLLSDPERKLITALGAGEGGKTKRSHFVFAPGGKLVDKKMPVKPVDSPKLALEFIKKYKAENA